MPKPLRLVINADPRDALFERASSHCPSLFDIEACRPKSICWSDLQEELGWLEEQGIVVRKADTPSGFAPMALEPLITRRAAAKKLKP